MHMICWREASLAALLLTTLACQGREPSPGSGPTDATSPAGDSAKASIAEQIQTLRQEARFLDAASLCDQRLEAAVSDPPTEEKTQLFNECGSVYRRASKSRKAIDLHHKALDIARQLGDRQGEASSLARLGLSLKDRGESHAALEANRAALAIFDDLEHIESVATMHHNTGSLLLSIGQPEAALAELNRALEIRQRSGEPGPLGSTLSKVANAYEVLGETARAQDLLSQALLYRKKAGDKLGEAATLDRIGVLHVGRGEASLAREPLESALEIVTELGDRPGQINSLANLGGVYLELGRAGEARQLFERGLELLSSHDDRNAEAHLRMGLGLAMRDLGDLPTAQALMEEALAVIEVDRGLAPPGMFRSGYLGIHQPFFEIYIDLLFERHRRQPDTGFALAAFWASERARARSLLDQITSGPLRPRADLTPTLFAPMAALRQKITRLELDRLGLALARPAKTDHGDEADREKQESQLLFEYRELLAALWSHREPAELAIESQLGISFLGIDDATATERLRSLQALLGDDTVLLSYFLGSRRSFLFTIDDRGLRMTELPARKQIEQVARDLRTSLRQNRDRSRQRRTERIANQLSRMILAPAGLCQGSRRLAVIADGWLQYLPFSVLPDSGAGSSHRPTEAPLVAHREVVYLPSASVLITLRQRRRGRGADLRDHVAVIAPGFERTGSPAAVFPSPLPVSKEEAMAILAMADSEHSFALLGPEATKEAFDAADFSQIGILHFATHGLLHPKYPELSALALSPGDPHSTAESDLLHLFEIFELQLPVEMVVLSACETALGELLPGEGLVGMSFGFLAVGASRVVVSLWRVDDRATAELMTEFYRGLLQQNLPPAAALSRAQNLLRQSELWSAPYYWAGFVLQGEWL